MSVTRASELWNVIKPYAMQDLKAMQSAAKVIASTVGYQITLHSEKTRYYEATTAGLDAAIAAATSGDMISLPPSSIDGNHSVPAGVSLFGIDRNRSILTGQITLAANAHLGKVSVVRSGSSGGGLTGVILAGSNARVQDCIVSISNSGGNAVGVYCNTGVTGYVDDSVISATGTGTGYGCYVNSGTLYIQSGRSTGSTGATGGTTVIYRMAGIENIFMGSSSIAWNYDAVDETIEAAVLPAGVDHDSLLNFVANAHVDHEDVEVIAGDGLTGGGDLLASRTLNLDTPGTLGVASVNDAGGNHSHAITTSSNPGAAAQILATNASGYLQLVRLGIGASPTLPLHLAGDALFEGGGGDDQVRFGSGMRLQSTDYASQVSGWGISYGGSGDFRYLYADQLHAKAFVSDLEQSLAGGQIICKSVAPLASDFTAPAAEGSAALVVESFKGWSEFKVFEDGDVVRLRQFVRTGNSLDVSDCWGTVEWVSTDTENKTQTYTFTRSPAGEAGALAESATLPAGSLALDYGASGNGTIESNAIDGAMGENSPYIQVTNWQYHPDFEGGIGTMKIGSSFVVGGAGSRVRTRMGNLKGIFNLSGEYGLYAGLPARYLRISNKAVEAHNLPISMFDGVTETVKLDPDTPSFALGSTLPTGFLTGEGIWMGKDVDGDYKLRIGDPAGPRLEWNGADLSIFDAFLHIGEPDGPRIVWDGSDFLISDAFLTLAGEDAGIAIGTTPPTASDAGTGIWIDRTGYYSLLDGVPQVKIDADDGTLYAGEGNVRLNADGIHILCPIASPIDKSNITWGNANGIWNEITSHYVNGSGWLDLKSHYESGSGGGKITFTINGVGEATNSHMSYGYNSTEGYHIMYLNGVRALDIFHGALLVGSGGLYPYMTHQQGDIFASGKMEIYGDAWFGQNVSALSFTDRTPFFEGDALAEVLKIRGKKGEIDHGSLPVFARKTIRTERVVEKKGRKKGKDEKVQVETVEQEGRDLGAMVSLLTVAVQQLAEKVQRIEEKKL